MLCRKNNVDFVKRAVFRAKSSEIAHTKTALAAKVANFFLINFCFVSSKDQLKLCKIGILSFHALQEK